MLRFKALLKGVEKEGERIPGVGREGPGVEAIKGLAGDRRRDSSSVRSGLASYRWANPGRSSNKSDESELVYSEDRGLNDDVSNEA